MKKLTRGARATFYRDGAELHSACDIPVEGAFAVRDLPPGQWVVRDSCGGEQAFTVTVGEEVAVVLDGASPGVTGGPGMSGRMESPSLRVGPGGGALSRPGQVASDEGITGPVVKVPGERPHEKVARLPEREAARTRPRRLGSEERVPGQSGAAFSQEGVPILSADEVNAAAAERLRAEQDGQGEQDAGEVEEVPKVVAPDPQGPEPAESTLPPAEEQAAALTPAAKKRARKARADQKAA